jgi:hypothetical protein
MKLLVASGGLDDQEIAFEGNFDGALTGHGRGDFFQLVLILLDEFAIVVLPVVMRPLHA